MIFRGGSATRFDKGPDGERARPPRTLKFTVARPSDPADCVARGLLPEAEA